MTPEECVALYAANQPPFAAYRAEWRAEAKALLAWEIAERALEALEGPGVIDAADEEAG